MIPINPNDPIKILLEVKIPPMTEEEKEKHNIFLLLSLTLVYDNWCIPKNDPKLVEAYKKVDPHREFSDYVGHNIGALLVGPDNAILCYALNNNSLFNHSTEHAEARVVRKGLRVHNRLRFKSGQGLAGYSSILKGHTVYTTLESCSQCSGIMDLANVARVVYAQDDPGQGHIGNVLYSFHKDEEAFGAPLPVHADFLPVFGLIAEAYKKYCESDEGILYMRSRPRPGVTGFLTSLLGYAAYRDAVRMFEQLQPQYEKNRQIFHAAMNFRQSNNRIEMRDAIFGE